MKNYYRQNQEARKKRTEKHAQRLEEYKGVLWRRADGGLPLKYLEAVVKAKQVYFRTWDLFIS